MEEELGGAMFNSGGKNCLDSVDLEEGKEGAKCQSGIPDIVL